MFSNRGSAANPILDKQAKWRGVEFLLRKNEEAWRLATNYLWNWKSTLYHGSDHYSSHLFSVASGELTFLRQGPWYGWLAKGLILPDKLTFYNHIYWLIYLFICFTWCRVVIVCICHWTHVEGRGQLFWVYPQFLSHRTILMSSSLEASTMNYWVYPKISF